MSLNIDVFKEIQASYKQQRLIPLVGSGFSKNIYGYPDWNELVKIMRDDIIKLYKKDKNFKITTFKSRFKDLPSNLERAEYYIRAIGKHKAKKSHKIELTNNDYRKIHLEGKKALVEKLIKLFDDKKTPYKSNKWRVHLELLKKFNKIIYTTNWDDTLEREELKEDIQKELTIELSQKLNKEPKEKKRKELRKSLEELQNKSKMGGPKSNFACSKRTTDGKPRIIKFHGDCSPIGKNFLVASLTDYNERITHENQLDIKLKSDLIRYDFLLLGYSLNDPNIHLMLHNLNKILIETNHLLRGNHINTRIYFVSLEKDIDLRIKLLKDTFMVLRPYYLLDEKFFRLKHKRHKYNYIRNKWKHFFEKLV